MAQQWFSATQAADYLGVHTNTLKRISPEQLPYMRVTSRGDRRYRIEDIEGYIDSKMIYTSTKIGAWAR